MSRALITLNGKADRERAIDWIERLPARTRVEFKKPARSNDQNSLMWGRLTDIATQLRWHGRKLTPKQWKRVFMDALNGEVEADLVPSIDGERCVDLGDSTSDLAIPEMSDLIEIINAFGAQHGVVFHDTETEPA